MSDTAGKEQALPEQALLKAKRDDALYESLSRKFESAKAYRNKYVDPKMEEAIELVLPVYGEFGSEPSWPDCRFDSIGTECVELLADGMFGNLTPSNQMWFRYQFEDPKLNEDKASAKALEELTDHMLKVFNRSTYYDVGPELLQMGITVGTGSMDIHEEKSEGRIICSPEHPRAVYVTNDAMGQVAVVFVVKYMTAEQAVEEYGEENIEDSIKEHLKTNDNTEFEFVECVKRNPNVKPNSPFATEWAWQEYSFRRGDTRKMILRQRGARTFTKPTWRWKTRGSNPYGWAPVATAMPDIRTCNQIVRTWLMNLQKTADPASFDPEEGRNWSRDPGSRNFYRDPNRRGYYDQLPPMTPAIEATLDVMQKRVRQALKVDSFLMLMQMEAQMTAREIVERKREGMTVVSSTVGKFETETLDWIHERFLSIEAQGGRLKMLPPELTGNKLKVEYLGPISQMQREIFIEQGIVSAIETSATIFTIWPETKMKIKGALLVDRIWRANGAPEDALRNDEEYTQVLDQIAKAKQQADQQAQMAALGAKINPMEAAAPGSPAEMFGRHDQGSAVRI